MTWARITAALGLLLLLGGFCLGVDTPISVDVAGQTHACADVIGPATLVSGQPRDSGSDSRPPAERRLAVRVDAACAPLERRARAAVWGAFGLGALLLLTGWTVLRERPMPDRRALAAAV